MLFELKSLLSKETTESFKNAFHLVIIHVYTCVRDIYLGIVHVVDD